VRRKLRSVDNGDRQMVDILVTVLTDEVPRAAMDAVEAACAEALAEDVHSADAILRMASLNILARRRDPPPPLTTCGAPSDTPDALQLSCDRCAPCAACNARC